MARMWVCDLCGAQAAMPVGEKGWVKCVRFDGERISQDDLGERFAEAIGDVCPGCRPRLLENLRSAVVATRLGLSITNPMEDGEPT